MKWDRNVLKFYLLAFVVPLLVRFTVSDSYAEKPAANANRLMASPMTGQRPPAITGSATNAQERTATLTGLVNPNGMDTVAWFEYGTTASYGSQSIVTSVGSGLSQTSVTAALVNLPTDSTIHFRLVAQNTAGKSYGADGVFLLRQLGTTNFGLQFDGTSQDMQLILANALLLQGSIELWVRWEGMQTNRVGGSTQVFGPVFSFGYFPTIGLDNPDPALAHIVWAPANHRPSIRSMKFAGDGVWHHVAVTIEPGDHRLYVDGELQGTAARSDMISTSYPYNFLVIGGGLTSRSYSRCTLDDVRLWTVVRSSEQIRSFLSRPLDSATPGLLIFWRMDEGVGGVVSDVTGHGFNGTLNGAPTWTMLTDTMKYGIYLDARLVRNQFQMTFTGNSGQPFVLQSSVDLATWLNVLTNRFGANRQFIYNETNSSAGSRRFYRILAP